MLNQKVSVDMWAMFQSMLGYLALAVLGGIFIRLMAAAITLPRRLRQQKENVQKAMDELRLKYPDAFKDIEEELAKEGENVDDKEQCVENSTVENTSQVNVVDKKIN